jgi:hypothetical protein
MRVANMKSVSHTWRYIAALMVMLVLLVPPVHGSETTPRMAPMSVEQVQRGSLLLKLASGGVSVDAHMLKTDVDMDISGMLARVSVRQKFKNISKDWIGRRGSMYSPCLRMLQWIVCVCV